MLISWGPSQAPPRTTYPPRARDTGSGPKCARYSAGRLRRCLRHGAQHGEAGRYQTIGPDTPCAGA
nr:MAG TPA: hypothetical protein [Caudoviricetes sp.]